MDVPPLNVRTGKPAGSGIFRRGRENPGPERTARGGRSGSGRVGGTFWRSHPGGAPGSRRAAGHREPAALGTHDCIPSHGTPRGAGGDEEGGGARPGGSPRRAARGGPGGGAHA